MEIGNLIEEFFCVPFEKLQKQPMTGKAIMYLWYFQYYSFKNNIDLISLELITTKILNLLEHHYLRLKLILLKKKNMIFISIYYFLSIIKLK